MAKHSQNTIYVYFVCKRYILQILTVADMILELEQWIS